MIELDGLTKRYDGVVVVDQLSLAIPRGQLLVLLGGSGSGKTTTLKMINRLIRADRRCHSHRDKSTSTHL